MAFSAEKGVELLKKVAGLAVTDGGNTKGKGKGKERA